MRLKELLSCRKFGFNKTKKLSWKKKLSTGIFLPHYAFSKRPQLAIKHFKAIKNLISSGSSALHFEKLP
jgi:hypothetical protein